MREVYVRIHASETRAKGRASGSSSMHLQGVTSARQLALLQSLAVPTYPPLPPFPPHTQHSPLAELDSEIHDCLLHLNLSIQNICQFSV